MNGERQLKEFINKPCKSTMMAFVKSLFSSKGKRPRNLVYARRRRSLMWKIANLRWKEDRCDVLHRGSPFAKCVGCPYLIEVQDPAYYRHHTSRCYFTDKFHRIFDELPGVSNNTINQHQWPKALMEDMGFLLMGAIKLQNALELRKEEKHDIRS